MSKLQQRFQELEKRYRQEYENSITKGSFQTSVSDLTNQLEIDSESFGAEEAIAKTESRVGGLFGYFSPNMTKPKFTGVDNPLAYTPKAAQRIAEPIVGGMEQTYEGVKQIPRNPVAGIMNTVGGLANTTFGTMMLPLNVGMGVAEEVGLEKPVKLVDKGFSLPAEGYDKASEFLQEKFNAVENSAKLLGVEKKTMQEIYDASKGLGEIITTLMAFGGAHKGVSALKGKLKGKTVPEIQQEIINVSKDFSKNENWQKKVDKVALDLQNPKNAQESILGKRVTSFEPTLYETKPQFGITNETLPIDLVKRGKQVTSFNAQPTKSKPYNGLTYEGTDIFAEIKKQKRRDEINTNIKNNKLKAEQDALQQRQQYDKELNDTTPEFVQERRTKRAIKDIKNQFIKNGVIDERLFAELYNDAPNKKLRDRIEQLYNGLKSEQKNITETPKSTIDPLLLAENRIQGLFKPFENETIKGLTVEKLPFDKQTTKVVQEQMVQKEALVNSLPKGLDKKSINAEVKKQGLDVEPKPEGLIIDSTPKTKKEAKQLNELAGAQAIRTPDGKIYVQNGKNHKAVLRKVADEIGAEEVNKLALSGKLEIGFIEDGKFSVKEPYKPKQPEPTKPIVQKSEQPRKVVEPTNGKKLPNKSEMPQKKVTGAKDNKSEMPDKQTFGQSDLSKVGKVEEQSVAIERTIEQLNKRDIESQKIAQDLERGKITLEEAEKKSLKIAERKIAELAKAKRQGEIKRVIEKQNKPITDFDNSIKSQSDIARGELVYDYNASTFFDKTNESRNLTLLEGKGSLRNLESTSKPNQLWSKEVDKAYQNIKEKSLGRSNMFGDPTIVKDYAVVGFDYIQKGARKFSDWSKKMVETFSEKIKPHLLKIWDSIKKEFGKQLIELDRKNPFSMTKSVVEGKPFEVKKKKVNEIKESIKKENKNIHNDKPKPTEIADELGVEIKETLFTKAWGYTLSKSETRLRSFGKAGNKLADKFKKAEEAERSNSGLGEQYLYDISKLSKNELKNLQDIEKALVLQNVRRKPMDIPKPINKNVEDILNGVNEYYKDAVKRAKEAGLDVNEIRDYQYRPLTPNISIEDLRVKKNKEGRPLVSDKRAKMLKEMVEEGTAKNISEAAFILDNYISARTTKKSTHLEYSRTHPLPSKYYITDPMQTLTTYILDAEKRIAHAKEFGVKNELAKDIFNEIRNEAGESADRFARKLFKYETGHLNGSELRMLQAVNLVKGWQTVTKFSPFTTLRNSFQGILGSSTRGNFVTAAKGLIKSFSEEAQRNAYKSGALHDQISKIITKDLGGAGKVTDTYLKAIGFTQTDVINRVISSSAGEVFYTNMLKRLKNNSLLKRRASREFERMGLDSKSILGRGKFTESELNIIRRTFAGDTQFNVRPLDLPLFWSSPTGKLITQWKSFGYKMGELIYKNVIGEAKKGNLAPLSTMLVAYGLTGEAVNTIIDYIRGAFKGDFGGEEAKKKSILFGDLESDEIIVRLLKDVGGLGAFGLYVDVLRSFGYGKSGATSVFFGPVAGELVDFSSDNLTPVGQLLESGTTKNFAKNTAKGGIKTIQRNLPGSGTFRTIGLWKWINDTLFDETQPTKRTSRRTTRRTSRRTTRR